MSKRVEVAEMTTPASIPKPEPRGPVMIPIAEAARRLNKSDKTLRRWMAAGYGPHAYRVGVTIQYRSDELDRWVLRQRIAPVSDAA